MFDLSLRAVVRGVALAFAASSLSPLRAQLSWRPHLGGPQSPAPTAQIRPCAPRFTPTPTWRTAVDVTSTSGCGSAAWPYSARFSPNGDRLYVPLFGGYIGGGGCRVARLDPITFATLAEIPTGESPQEVAFTTNVNGSVNLGFVSNSSSSTVTVFDALDNVVATIPIPFAPGSFFPTAFPSGLVTSPDQSHVYVGTLDGSGVVYAIDTATLTLDPTKEIHLGADVSTTRMVFARNLLVIPASEALPNWAGSTAKVVVVDPAHPQALRELPIATASTGVLFPSPQDCAVDCDNIVWLAGFDMGAFVFGVEPRSLTLRYAIPTHTSQPDGKFQALGLSKDGLLVVGDAWTHELSILEARTRRWRTTLDTTLLSTVQRGPQDVEFAPNADTLLVPWAGTDNIGVYDF